MTQSDQMKIMRCGFKIIRRDYNNLLIKVKSKKYKHWTIYYKGFRSKAALDREMANLLEDDLIIED